MNHPEPFNFGPHSLEKSLAITNIVIVLRKEILQEAVVYLLLDESSLFQVYAQSLEIHSMVCSQGQPLSQSYFQAKDDCAANNILLFRQTTMVNTILLHLVKLALLTIGIQPFPLYHSPTLTS